MERDFTIGCRDHFCSLIDQINEDNWCGITDWFGDLFWSFKHLLSDWGLLDYTNRMNTYYKELLDRENTSKEQVIQMLEDVSGLDTSFADLYPDHFGCCRNFAKDIRRSLYDIIRLLSINPSASLSNTFSLRRINDILGTSLVKLQYFSLPAPEYQITPSTFSTFSQEEKEAFIHRCGSLSPDLATAVDRLFTDSDWTEQEKLDIKFMLYNAAEPYRSIFFRNTLFCNMVVFQQGSEDSNGYTFSLFSPARQTVYLEDLDSNLVDNPRAPYNTFFHEFGHAADYATHQRNNYLSQNFWVDGDNLHTCIANDAQNYILKLFEDTCAEKNISLSNTDKSLLLASLNININRDPEFKYIYGGDRTMLSERLQKVRGTITSAIYLTLGGEANSAASDIFGGVTNNAVPVPYGHSAATHGEAYKYYWYNENGTMTKMQAAELWAEFYAAQMTGDEEALTSIREHFPTAYPMLEKMASQMAAP